MTGGHGSSSSRLHHLGVAVVDLDEAVNLYGSLVGATLVRRTVNEAEGLQAALMKLGDVELELMSATRADTPVGRFLARRGPGLHHVAYAVPDLDAKLAEVLSAGMELIDSTPRLGMHGSRIAFVHPKSVGGVLTEFVEA